jgi:hypothetical protein
VLTTRNATSGPGNIAFVATTPPARGLRSIDPTPFRLRLERTAPRADDGQPAGLDGVLADLDRRIRLFGAGFGAPWAARRAHGLRGGFRWDGEDSRTKAWYPQGIAASADGRIVVVSWYHKASNAARVSFADLKAARYRHVPLITADGKAVRTHAGGLAWHEDLLYVTETTKGLRVFDLTRIERTSAAGDERYVLPEVARYRPDGETLRFSFTSVDEAGSGLLIGEYTDQAPGARLVRWPFAAGGLLAQESASDAWVTAHSNLQGAVALGKRMLMAESRGARLPGRLHVSPYGETVEQRGWAVGGEDLAVAGGEILSLSEHPDFPRPLPRRRTVFRTAAP